MTLVVPHFIIEAAHPAPSRWSGVGDLLMLAGFAVSFRGNWLFQYVRNEDRRLPW